MQATFYPTTIFSRDWAISLQDVNSVWFDPSLEYTICSPRHTGWQNIRASRDSPRQGLDFRFVNWRTRIKSGDIYVALRIAVYVLANPPPAWEKGRNIMVGGRLPAMQGVPPFALILLALPSSSFTSACMFTADIRSGIVKKASGGVPVFQLPRFLVFRRFTLIFTSNLSVCRGLTPLTLGNILKSKVPNKNDLKNIVRVFYMCINIYVSFCGLLMNGNKLSFVTWQYYNFSLSMSPISLPNT